ncbi:MAG: FxLYD domain-containing protein [Eubacteriales bacterium]
MSKVNESIEINKLDTDVKEPIVVKEDYYTVEPVITANQYIEIIDCRLLYGKKEDKRFIQGVAIEVKNISEGNIGKVTYEIELIDSNGCVIEEIQKNLNDIGKGDIKSVYIELDTYIEVDVRSYNLTIINLILTPAPIVIGNERIEILHHTCKPAGTEPRVGFATTIEIAIRNISDKTVATAIFDVAYYDSEGNILDSFQHRETELKPKTSRAIMITTEKVKFDDVKSYRVNLREVITTDFEKIHLIKYDMIKTQNGWMEVTGIVKNISEVNINGALLIHFKDTIDKNISAQAIILRDICPGSVRNFYITFNPPEGTIVRICTIDVAEIIKVV